MTEDLSASVRDLYADAEDRLLRLIARQLSGGYDAPGRAQRKLAAVQALRRSAQTLVDELGKAVSLEVLDVIAESYNRGHRAAVAELGTLSDRARRLVDEITPQRASRRPARRGNRRRGHRHAPRYPACRLRRVPRGRRASRRHAATRYRHASTGDRDGKFPDLFDAVLADAGIEVVLSGVRMPRMNSIMERWVQTCRRELLDRTLIWSHRHLLHALREFEHFYNGHRPHQGIANARPLHPLPAPIDDPDTLARLDIRRRDRLGGLLHEYQHAP